MSDAFRTRRTSRPGERVAPVLHVLLHASMPAAATSRHRLDGVERVDFGRGSRAAVRTTEDGERRLRLQVPDPMMSSDHGRLSRVNGQWILEDPRSKNGAVVAGRPTRVAPVRADDLFELGHTVFWLSDEVIDDDEPLDRTSDGLRAPLPDLATFDARVARQVRELAQVATSTVPVVLGGESGTGKEVFARALHGLSGRRGAFVAVNCGGIAPQLLEAELFGHRKGAFSGATEDRPGYVRAADRGTLFLDEIGDLPSAAQAALLRVLQERAVVPVGESTPVAVDFRLCAATHRDLAARVEAGEFRADLHARLLGATFVLPPLRDRRGDLGLLIRRLLAREPGGDQMTLTPAAAYALLRHDWPLNVRELERTLAAAVARAGRGPIDVGHLPPHVAAPPASSLEDDGAAVDGPAGRPAGAGAGAEDDEVLRATLVEALTRHGGNVTAVARDLGKHREQVNRWVRRFAIDLDGFRR